MDRGAWWATVHRGHTESGMTEVTEHTCTPMESLVAACAIFQLQHMGSNSLMRDRI